ncbi:MAG: ComF family protein [Candidatus Omnitrophota bacterium]
MPICELCKEELLLERTLPVISSRHLPEIWSCLPYNGAVKECIKKFKYSGQKQIINFFGELTRHFLDESTISHINADLIVPVPIHLARRLARGYNQSELLAKALSDLTCVPFSMNNLIKTRNTHPQIGLSKNSRIKNLRGSFSVPRPSPVVGKSIMLVDDVMTTGATLEACAAELLRAGAQEVRGFTIARTL